MEILLLFLMIGHNILWSFDILQLFFLMSLNLRPHGLYSPSNSPGLHTEVGSLSLLQGIFLTQGLNQGLLHCRWIIHQLSYHQALASLNYTKYWHHANVSLKTVYSNLLSSSLPSTIWGPEFLSMTSTKMTWSLFPGASVLVTTFSLFVVIFSMCQVLLLLLLFIC